jgi:hypothetical protein
MIKRYGQVSYSFSFSMLANLLRAFFQTWKRFQADPVNGGEGLDE